MIDLITDSRKIKPQDTFIAIKTLENDGHKYINEAIKNGAKKIIAEYGEYPVDTLIVKDTTKYLKEYIYNKYYNKIKDIKLIGVTGTSGKTTTCFLTYTILKKLGHKAAYIGTIGFYMEKFVRKLQNTTPQIDELYNCLLECKEKNIEYVVIEISSHSIDLDRIYGLKFDAAAFTNISQEHLDYHKTLENYANTKAKLFKRLRNKKTAIINKDDKYSNKFILQKNSNITISEKQGDIRIYDINLTNQGTIFNFNYKEKEYKKIIDMVGKYNVYNYMTAIMLVNSFKNNIEEILKIEVQPPRGRMQMVKYKTNSIFVDYAHKPDAVKKVLESTLEFAKGRIITIIGCGGNRDKTKRPIMGNISSENSNYVIFTNDNPRNEEPEDIIKDIIKGVKKNNYEIILDRKEAINKGISLLKQNDILLILGKGHEDYQIIKQKKYHLDDMECVLKRINELKLN